MLETETDLLHAPTKTPTNVPLPTTAFLPIYMNPTNNVWLMRCQLNAQGVRWSCFFWLVHLWKVRQARIISSPSLNPRDRSSACLNQCLSTTAFPIHMDSTNNVWLMRCVFNAHGSHMELFSLIDNVCQKLDRTGLSHLPATTHETDLLLLHVPINVPLPQHLPSIWTQQTTFDQWDDASSMPMGHGSQMELTCLRLVV
jgi:hypothetical protein